MTGTLSIDETDVAELAAIQRNTRLNTPQSGQPPQSVAPQNQNLLGRILQLSFLGNPSNSLDPTDVANKKFSETYGNAANPEPTDELPIFGDMKGLQRDVSGAGFGSQRGRHSSLGAGKRVHFSQKQRA